MASHPRSSKVHPKSFPGSSSPFPYEQRLLVFPSSLCNELIFSISSFESSKVSVVSSRSTRKSIVSQERITNQGFELVELDSLTWGRPKCLAGLPSSEGPGQRSCYTFPRDQQQLFLPRSESYIVPKLRLKFKRLDITCIERYKRCVRQYAVT